jgi:hypothetical protein
VGFSRGGIRARGRYAGLGSRSVGARKSLLARARACALSSYCGCPRRTFCTAFARADLTCGQISGPLPSQRMCSLVFWACRTDILLNGMGRFARARGVRKNSHRIPSRNRVSTVFAQYVWLR